MTEPFKRMEKQMSLSIREFRPDDYERAVEISNRVYYEYPDTVDEWRFQDDHRDPKCRFQRYVGEIDGLPVATASFGNSSHMYHPRKFWIDVTVDPDHQRKGVGSALYDHLETVLTPTEPIKLWSGTREDFADSLRFLEKRGFKEVMRAWESRLYVDDFDIEPFEGRIEAVESSGLTIETFASLSGRPDHLEQLYDLVETVDRDVPSPEEPTAMGFDVWVDRVVHNPNLMPDAYFIALDGDQYVALSNLWLSQAQKDELYVGLTGTRREYRRRGIATALKLKSIEYAACKGIKVLKTWNETGNEGMLAINTALGFVRQPAWIDHEKLVSA
jgi:GNAT superfamily N-acetyltransferase